MPLHAKIDHDLPVPDTDQIPETDLFAKTSAAVQAAQLLAQYGLEVDIPTNEEMEGAGVLAAAYARDPEGTSLAATPARMAKMTPAELLLTKEIIQKFGHSVVDSAVQIRHTVTNKLIQETENPDPRIRLRALELLGKITDVGLFTERSEVTVTHQTSDDLRAKLREKLQKLKDVTPAAPEEAEIIYDDEPKHG
jgi:hypothetical protein